VVGLLVEVEFVPIYAGQPLFSDVQQLLEAAGFRLAAIKQHEEFSPFRGPIGARGKGFVLSGEALFLRRSEEMETTVADVDRRYVMLHKLAFTSIMFDRLEYALSVLDAARALKPSRAIQERLEQQTYIRFLQEMQNAAAALPPVKPPTFGESMSFEDAQARFRV
jgi:hypothetical protein